MGESRYYKRFEEYTPRAVIRESKGVYSWPSANASKEELAEFKSQEKRMVWTAALAGDYYMLDLTPSFLMTKERAEAEALSIAKHLKIALDKV